MKISVLSSGSSGNCFYVENENCAVLIDAGISAKQIVERLEMIGEDVRKVKAVFITHEHTDHIKGVDVFSRKFEVPVFATRKTIEDSNLRFCENIKSIKNDHRLKFGKVTVEAFSKSHKAAEPVSYNLINGKKISIITDAGYFCENISKNVRECDFLCIESNYDEEMLDTGPYPFFLRKWIRGNEGHLSNLQTALGILENGTPKLKNILLCHLSQNNNTPEKAVQTFKYITKERYDLKFNLGVSERDKPTAIFEL